MVEPRGNGFGARIRHYREARGQTQAGLAAMVGRSHSMLSAIEHGTRQIHVDELLTFAQALDVDPSTLLGVRDDDLFDKGYRKGWNDAMRRVSEATEVRL